jgi:hypothetical protein
MKDSAYTEKLLDLPYAPEAEAYLDELERSGQFRVGIEAEAEDAESTDAAASNDYTLGRGSGSLSIQDWWTTGRVAIHVSAGLAPDDIALARVSDSLIVRTQDGLDRAVLEGYLGLIPDASTLLIVFSDGTEWAGAELLTRLSAVFTSQERGAHSPPTASNH